MKVVEGCPAEFLIQGFKLGRLDAATAETVGRHLQTCAACRDRAFGGTLSAAAENPAGGAPPGRTASRVDRTFVPGESISNAVRPAETVPPGAAAGRAPSAPSAAPGTGIPSELANHPDYEVVKELGRGGMGVVYLARNRMMDRLEVLKVVSKSLLDRPGALERFQQEIRSAARLSHPNIVGAHSVLRLGELLVLAMEYVDGQDLAAFVLERGALPVANAAFYAHQAALGLQHAHEKGMVHRDIKPNNLILALEGRKHVVKILDFGLAKATSEKSADAGLTKTGQMLGTPDYIAPEQTLDAQKADIRADIYSLGCTLYFLLSGRPPFDGTSLYAILQAHHTVEAKSLNLVRADVPPALAAVVAGMMAKDPARRYQTPIDVARALVPFFKGGQPAGEAQVSAAAAPNVRAASAGAAPAPIPITNRPTAPREATMLESPAAGPVPDSSPAATSSSRRQLGIAIAVGLLVAAVATAGAILFKPGQPAATAHAGSGETLTNDQPPASTTEAKPTQSPQARPQDAGSAQLDAVREIKPALESAAPAVPPLAPPVQPVGVQMPTTSPPGLAPPAAGPLPSGPLPSGPLSTGPLPTGPLPNAQPPVAAENQTAPPAVPAAASPPSAPSAALPTAWTQDIELPQGKKFAVNQIDLSPDRLQAMKNAMGKNPFEMTYSEDNSSSISGSLKGKLNGPTLSSSASDSLIWAANYKDASRDGPLRIWDGNGDLMLYAEYKADYQGTRLNGMTCIFQNGLPWVLLQYNAGKLAASYLVEFSSGTPVAQPLESGAASAGDQDPLGAALSRLAKLEEELTVRERAIKRGLAEAFKDADLAKKQTAARKGSVQKRYAIMRRGAARDAQKSREADAAIRAGMLINGAGAAF